MIGGHKPPGHNSPGSEPPVSGKAGRNPYDITPCRIRTQCIRCGFLLQKRWFCGFYPALSLNDEIVVMSGGGVISGHLSKCSLLISLIWFDLMLDIDSKRYTRNISYGI